MAITVYWASLEDEWLRMKSPEYVYKELIKKTDPTKTDLKSCPAVKDYLKNYVSLRSIYDYEFDLDNENNNITSKMYDQKFFDKHINIRSSKAKLFSFTQYTIFFTEEKSLELSAGLFPFMEDNNITKNCIIIPGTLDIGKWFRSLEFAFILKGNKFKIEEGEIYTYLSFNTKEKIIFKQFKPNDILKSYMDDFDKSRKYRKDKFRELTNYYEMLKNKNKIIKEIKNNLID
jgi:hypothetical protein